MPPTIIPVTEKSLQAHLANADQPVLLDLWAPWCAPCRALTPTLERLAEEAGDQLAVLKLDIDEYPAVRERYAVRGIPTMILLKGESELGRLIGVQTLSHLKQWLGEKGAPLANATLHPMQAPQPWGAFYGDAQLREFLVNRMKQHADNGDVSVARSPMWINGKGTFSATFVHSESLHVFERLTGLPASLAPALDFVGACDERDVSVLLDSLRINADLSLVPVRLLQHWLGDPEHHWAEILDEPALDALRVEWLALCAQSLAGKPLAPWAWDELRRAATQLHSEPNSPHRELQGMVARLLSHISPIPAKDHAAAWRDIFNLADWCSLHLLMHSHGWSALERATPALRSEWFERSEHELGGFDSEQLKGHREQWNSENSEFLAKEQRFHAQYTENCKVPNRRRIAVLTNLLAKSPLYLPA